jgi:hypothetical protein
MTPLTVTMEDRLLTRARELHAMIVDPPCNNATPRAHARCLPAATPPKPVRCQPLHHGTEVIGAEDMVLYNGCCPARGTESASSRPTRKRPRRKARLAPLPHCDRDDRRRARPDRKSCAADVVPMPAVQRVGPSVALLLFVHGDRLVGVDRHACFFPIAARAPVTSGITRLCVGNEGSRRGRWRREARRSRQALRARASRRARRGRGRAAHRRRR